MIFWHCLNIHSFACPVCGNMLMVIAVAFELAGAGEAQNATATLPVILIVADGCKLLWL